VSPNLERISVQARAHPALVLTSLSHHIADIEHLRACYRLLNGKKAVGVDAVTKAMYAEELETNLQDVAARLKRMGYRPQPKRRVYIPKPGSKPGRPLGISSFEDKIVELATKRVVEPLCESLKVWPPLMVQVYHLQKAHPDAGRFRIWSLLARPDLSEPPSATSWPSISSSIPTSRTTNRWGCVTLHSYTSTSRRAYRRPKGCCGWLAHSCEQPLITSFCPSTLVGMIGATSAVIDCAIAALRGGADRKNRRHSPGVLATVSFRAPPCTPPPSSFRPDKTRPPCIPGPLRASQPASSVALGLT
jgi:hypothetical protein